MTDMPKHIGFILDGNRRWAKERGLPTLEGHRTGYDNLKTLAEHAFDQGVEFVTAYIFSTENWKRSKTEVDYLMRLARRLLTQDGEELIRRGYRVVMLGSRQGISTSLLSAIDKLEAKAPANPKGTLGLCFNYGGQQEIVDAVQTLMQETADANRITAETIAEHLYAPDIPPIDLVIRTSGEQRLSNFMLWRAAYAELYFEEKYWPALTVDDFDRIMRDYAKRKRRFGA